MEQIIDFHIHSPFSRGVSKNMTLPLLAEEARKKGLDIIGTGDVFHKEWNTYLQKHLIKETDGIYSLKKQSSPVRFIASGEIEDNEHIHHLVLMPSLKASMELAEEFEKINKIRISRYGGRPRVDLSALQLLEKVKEYGGLLGPAHIFTPFTSIFRENKYSSLKDCFKELSKNVDFIELGLSANSLMADKIKELWGYPFLSNSDSHSAVASKIGREANVFELREPSFSSIQKSLQKGKNSRIILNIGLDPRSGKYYLSFCYKCRKRVQFVKTSKQNYDERFIYVKEESKNHFLQQVSKKKERCPACNGLIKLGVNDRVELLKTAYKRNSNRPPYFNSIPLVFLIARGLKLRSTDSKTVKREYHRLISLFGNELKILLTVPLSEIKKENEYVGKKIEQMRYDKLKIIPGGGGHYGELL